MKSDLTHQFLNTLKPDANKRLEVSDTRRPGLRFRLSPSGHASWIYEKRIKGGPKRKFSLGTWPEPTSLSKARKLALEIEAEAARGIDRIANAEDERRKLKASQASLVTVMQAIEIYEDLHLSTIRTGAERKRQLLSALADHLEKSIEELTKRDLQAAVDRKAKEGRKPYANRIRAALVAFANWCFIREYVREPIGSGIAKATKEKARERVLSLEEVRAIWAASIQLGNVWGPYFRLAILTGQRRGEISNLRWSQVRFSDQTIVKPGSETKNGKPHTTHISGPALEQLKLLHERASESEFVFSFDGKRPVANPSHAKRRLDVVLGEDFERWRIHDLRTAMATTLAADGVAEGVVDRILNHAASGSAPSVVARVYQQSDLLPQRAAALDRWAELVVS